MDRDPLMSFLARIWGGDMGRGPNQMASPQGPPIEPPGLYEMPAGPMGNYAPPSTGSLGPALDSTIMEQLLMKLMQDRMFGQVMAQVQQPQMPMGPPQAPMGAPAASAQAPQIPTFTNAPPGQGGDGPPKRGGAQPTHQGSPASAGTRPQLPDQASARAKSNMDRLIKTPKPMRTKPPTPTQSQGSQAPTGRPPGASGTSERKKY